MIIVGYTMALNSVGPINVVTTVICPQIVQKISQPVLGDLVYTQFVPISRIICAISYALTCYPLLLMVSILILVMPPGCLFHQEALKHFKHIVWCMQWQLHPDNFPNHGYLSSTSLTDILVSGSGRIPIFLPIQKYKCPNFSRKGNVTFSAKYCHYPRPCKKCIVS